MKVIVLLSLAFTTLALRPHQDPHFAANRTVIVEMFEWKWSDIADECEQFLGPYGFGGVQISPANEYAALPEAGRPWWERYQPVSYKLVTRSGNEAQLRDMVHRCNRAQVRVYVDIVANHMTNSQSGTGSAGSKYDGNAQSYPGVPFGPNDFNGYRKCPNSDLSIYNFGDPRQVRNCRLFGLRDLNTESDYVRQKQIDFYNVLIDMGVAGFRIDSAQHIWPESLRAMQERLHPLKSDVFGSGKKPFFFFETVYFNDNRIKPDEYFGFGRAIDFRYARKLSKVFRKQDGALKDLKDFGKGTDGLADGDQLVVMIDNHDMQRGHTGDLAYNICFLDDKLFKMATAFMLARPFGVTRVMSSYWWDRKVVDGKDVNDSVGPPHDANFKINDVTRNPDLTCGNGWVCEHRWRQVYGMTGFRNAVAASTVENWWDNGANQIAFGRGGKGFVAFNNEHSDLNVPLATGMPAGTYCDVITANVVDGKCSGQTVTIGVDGKANIFVSKDSADGVLAFHIDSKVN